MFRSERIKVTTSRALFGALFASHVAACAAVWHSSLSLSICVLLSLVVGLHALQWYRRYIAMELADSVTTIFWNAEGLFVLDGTGREWSVLPLADSVVTTPCLWLYVQRCDDGRRLGIPLMWDSAHPDALRRLRVMLLLKGFAE